MPINHVLMSNKSYLLNKRDFRDIKSLLETNNINITFKNIIFKSDFEKSFLKVS